MGSPRIFRVRADRVDLVGLYRQYNVFMDQHRLQACVWGQACTACDPEFTTNVVHVQCWKLARLSFPSLSAVHLVQLARLTRPLLSGDFLPIARASTTPPPARLSAYTDLCYDTDLGRFIAQIQRRLPAELQHTIFQHARGLFGCLVRCLDTIHAYSRLGHYGSDMYETAIHHPLRTGVRPRHIGLNTINIMGETCIAMTGPGGSRSWHEELRLSTVQATGLQTAYGTFGVVAMRVLYIDGSSSPWLGGASSSRRRFKTCRGRLEDMQVVHDGFKIIGLELHRDNGTDTTSSPGVLWSDNEQPIRGQTYSLIDARLPTTQILGNSDTRVGLYLSLQGIRSLTVFCSGRGICSIQTNGDVTKRFGVSNDDAAAVTCVFAPGEYITTMWTLSRGSGEDISFGPFLIIATSTGRRFYHGPHHMMFYTHHMAAVSRFDQRGGKWRRPVGLFVDPTTAAQSLLHSVGVALEESSGHGHDDQEDMVLPGTRSADSRYFPRFHWERSFLSKASLANVRRLRVQTRGSRRVGLSIEHHGRPGATAILGQWDPAHEQDAKFIYDAEVPGTPPLSALTFIFSDQTFANGRCCIDIVVGRCKVVSGPSFTHDDLTQDVSWWYTSDHDYVESWQGTIFTFSSSWGDEIPATIVDAPESASFLEYIMRPFN